MNEVTKVNITGANIPVVENRMIKDRAVRLYSMTEERMEQAGSFYNEAWRVALGGEAPDGSMRDAYYRGYDALFSATFDRLGEATGLSRLTGMRVIRLRDGASSFVEKTIGARRVGELKLSVEIKL